MRLSPDTQKLLRERVFLSLTDISRRHRQLLSDFQSVQRKEHPIVDSILAPLLENFRQSQAVYGDFMGGYPLASYSFEHALSQNVDMKALVQVSLFLTCFQIHFIENLRRMA